MPAPGVVQNPQRKEIRDSLALTDLTAHSVFLATSPERRDASILLTHRHGAVRRRQATQCPPNTGRLCLPRAQRCDGPAQAVSQSRRLRRLSAGARRGVEPQALRVLGYCIMPHALSCLRRSVESTTDAEPRVPSAQPRATQPSDKGLLESAPGLPRASSATGDWPLPERGAATIHAPRPRGWPGLA